MNHLDILLPFGLPPAALAAELTRQCQTPALATLLARGKQSKSHGTPEHYDPFARALPHEHWLSRQFQLKLSAAHEQQQRGNSPPAAVALLRRHAPEQAQGHWFIVQPAHIHIARDHLLLTDIAQLALAHEHAQALFASAQALFAEVGRPLLYLAADIWLMRADDWAGLHTSSPLAASGRNIDIWMPAGNGELAWRKLQNEVQMQWFSEAHNEARDMLGQQPVNSLWLWGGGDAAIEQAASAYSHSVNLSGWAQALSLANHNASDATALLAGGGTRVLLLLDALQEAAMNEDWGRWLVQLEALERLWFAPLLQALRDKQLASLSLVLSGQNQLLELSLNAASLRKFWIKPRLSRLLPKKHPGAVA